eukprot:Plantae.Rhodophyta-Purpureofilum_apyrenoidigerum.ctg41895.p1 GENE.Plantae.Rhodophyta-Purpureofilum_apyrenoidigerum.ctg41895~~Plantae.Rhodophyta-Purpureofilum_apyrenoidigerum.ctg41895.p1  ORF type:complete len:354 (+),score=45.34 Plantae.Rhodophyta-Purpureofilum_apyrenoidigerum.ctg41895:193-1254(+)
MSTCKNKATSSISIFVLSDGGKTCPRCNPDYYIVNIAGHLFAPEQHVLDECRSVSSQWVEAVFQMELKEDAIDEFYLVANMRACTNDCEHLLHILLFRDEILLSQPVRGKLCAVDQDCDIVLAKIHHVGNDIILMEDSRSMFDPAVSSCSQKQICSSDLQQNISLPEMSLGTDRNDVQNEYVDAYTTSEHAAEESSLILSDDNEAISGVNQSNESTDIFKELHEEHLKRVLTKLGGKSKRRVLHLLTADDLVPFFDVPRDVLAGRLGICVTLLKKVCRKNGIKRWPYRKLLPIEKKISARKSQEQMTRLHKQEAAGQAITEMFESELASLWRQKQDILSDILCEGSSTKTSNH